MQAIGTIVEQPLEHFQMVQDTNCTGPVRMIQAFAPAMIKQACHCSSHVNLALQSYIAGHNVYLTAARARLDILALVSEGLWRFCKNKVHEQ